MSADNFGKRAARIDARRQSTRAWAAASGAADPLQVREGFAGIEEEKIAMDLLKGAFTLEDSDKNAAEAAMKEEMGNMLTPQELAVVGKKAAEDARGKHLRPSNAHQEATERLAKVQEALERYAADNPKDPKDEGWKLLLAEGEFPYWSKPGSKPEWAEDAAEEAVKSAKKAFDAAHGGGHTKRRGRKKRRRRTKRRRRKKRRTKRKKRRRRRRTRRRR